MIHTLWYNAELNQVIITTTFTDQVDFIVRMWRQGFELIGDV